MTLKQPQEITQAIAMRKTRQRRKNGKKMVVKQGRRTRAPAPAPPPPGDTCSLQFFKVFLPDYATQRLSIPPDFVNLLKKSLPRLAILTNNSGKTWCVNLENEGHNVYFKVGWEAFRRDMRLELGDFLVFTYDRESIFNVKIYGPNGCEKDQCISLKHKNWGGLDDQEEDRKSVIATLDENRNAHEDDETPTLAQRLKGSIESETYASEFHKKLALKEARKYISMSEYPSFSVILTRAYLSKHFINIPSAFIKEHFGCIIQSRTEIQMVGLGRIWPVRVLRYGKFCWRFGRGWHDFVVEANMKVQDVCVFELLKDTNHFLRISVFRCLKE